MLQTTIIKDTTAPEFTLVKDLYMSAFPDEERRDLTEWEACITAGTTRLYVFYWNNEFAGFLTTWRFNTFTYVEHFAISGHLRGQGVGSIAMKRCLEDVKDQMVLEVEKPTDETTNRRVRFYEHLGFHLCLDGYDAPAYPGKPKPVAMSLMAYPDALTKEGSQDVQRVLANDVYKCL